MDMTSPRLDAGDDGELEIELKLTMSPKSLSKLLLRLSKTSGADRTSRKTARIVSTYYDTQDRWLRQQGLTLRVRQKAGKRVQTVKSEGSSALGMFARTEWTTPIESRTPDLTVIKAPAIKARLGALRHEELIPLFKTDVKRTTLLMQHTRVPGDSATVELAFDQGRIVSGKKTDQISEVELELVKGTTTALLDLAKSISRQVPSILSLGSKVNRGFDLTDGTHPQASMAEKISLKKRHSVEEAMVHILRLSLNQLLANRNAAVSGKDIEGVHQARVAIRRILSALILFRKYLYGPEVEHIKAEARWLIDILGDARDIDVFINEVLAAVIQGRPDDKDLTALIRSAKKARTAAYRRVRSALSSRRYTTAMLDLSSWIEERIWRNTVTRSKLDAPIGPTSAKLLAKRHRKILKRGKDFADMDSADRHTVRIALKKVRYASEFFSALYPEKRTRPYIAAMRHLQTALGTANDIATAEILTESLLKQVRRGTKDADTIRSGVGKVLGWHSHAAKEANADVTALWTSFAKSKPFWPTSSR